MWASQVLTLSVRSSVCDAEIDTTSRYDIGIGNVKCEVSISSISTLIKRSAERKRESPQSQELNTMPLVQHTPKLPS